MNMKKAGLGPKTHYQSKTADVGVPAQVKKAEVQPQKKMNVEQKLIDAMPDQQIGDRKDPPAQTGDSKGVLNIIGQNTISDVEQQIRDLESQIEARGGVPGDFNPRPAIDPGTGLPNLQLPRGSRELRLQLCLSEHYDDMQKQFDFKEIWDVADNRLSTTKQSLVNENYAKLLQYQLTQLPEASQSAGSAIDPATGLPNLELPKVGTQHDEQIAAVEQQIEARGGVPGDFDPLPAIHKETGLPNLQLPLGGRLERLITCLSDDKHSALHEQYDFSEIWDAEHKELTTTKPEVVDKHYLQLIQYQLAQMQKTEQADGRPVIDAATGLPNLQLPDGDE